MTGARLLAAVCAVLIAWVLPALAGTTRVVVISDMNGSYGSVSYNPRVARAVQAIIGLAPALVISTGDMVAGQRRPTLSDVEVRAMWASFHATVSDPLARAGIPLAVTPGNHDASAYGGFEHERAVFAKTWRARRPDLAFIEGGDYPFFYAFDLAGIRFASLDATTVGHLAEEQMTQLRTAMAGSGSARIVFSHLPLWPFAIGRETEIIGDPALESLFVELDIDLHLSGHHHAFYPGAVAGIGFIAQACLGGGPRALIGTHEKSAPAITLLDISDDGRIVVSALTGPDFDESVGNHALPPSIKSPERMIERLDRADIPDIEWRPGQ